MGTSGESILQFGAGRFLRAFVDLFVHQMQQAGGSVGGIVVVQSTAGDRAEGLMRRGGKYHVAIRGLVDGRPVDTVEEVGSIRRALLASKEWSAVLAFARSPDLKIILSNTTEAGYELHTEDLPNDAPPRSFPAKLLCVLKARFDAGAPGVAILPCELFEKNADRLLGVVREQAARWNAPADFLEWMQSSCSWRNSLVDRIVSGVPAEHPLLAEDPMLIAAEPFALWAIEQPAGSPPDPGRFDHPAILRVADVTPYHLRKVRILNGSHTALVCKAAPLGFRTVREAVEDPAIGEWLRELLFEEIVPVVAAQAADAENFARQTLERFRNPFLEHKLSDIALHHDTKVRVRLAPTLDEFVARFGRRPKLLAALLDDLS